MQSTQPSIAHQSVPATPFSPVSSKGILHSKTFWGAVLTAVAAISPVVAKTVSEAQANYGKIDPNGVSQIVVILATTGVTILGRIDAKTTVYTPQGLPGSDKPGPQPEESVEG